MALVSASFLWREWLIFTWPRRLPAIAWWVLVAGHLARTVYLRGRRLASPPSSPAPSGSQAATWRHSDPARFGATLAVYVAVNVLLAYAVLGSTTVAVQRHTWNAGATESVLLPMPANTHVGMVLLGTSHGRNFSRFNNHQRVEAALGTRVVNLSRGNGSGVVPMLINLQRFFELGGSTDTVVYFLDPWVMYSASWNEDNPAFFSDEPFDLRFLAKGIANGVPPAVWFTYLRAKVSREWLDSAPEPLAGYNEQAVSWVDPTRVSLRLRSLYRNGAAQETFDRYAAFVERIVQLAQANGSRVALVVSPTLLGEEPGTRPLLALFAEMSRRYGVLAFDHRTAITDLEQFEDLDHLNTPGVVAYSRRYLLPILRRHRESTDRPEPIGDRLSP
jgi:hypothetical protein